MKNRIVYSDNTVLTDWSIDLNDFYTGTADMTLVSAEDAIYIGSTLPFNHLFAEVATANSTLAAIDVKLWHANGWQDVAQVIDETSSSGKSLSRSGFITWVPDKNHVWLRDDTVLPSSGGERVIGLGGIKIYDQFWAKITFNANLDFVSLKWIGNLFSNDYNLFSEFPDLRNTALINAYESGKTNWFEQHYLAGQIVIKDMLQKRTIVDSNQILDKDDLTLASTSKCAQIIYLGLGDDYVDNAKRCSDEYDKRMAAAYMKIDLNQNARIDQVEQRPYQFTGVLFR